MKGDPELVWLLRYIGGPFVGVLRTRALAFGIFVRAADFPNSYLGLILGGGCMAGGSIGPFSNIESQIKCILLAGLRERG